MLRKLRRRLRLDSRSAEVEPQSPKRALGDDTSLRSTVIDNGYDVGSGVFSAVNPEVRTELNSFGQYISIFSDRAQGFNDRDLQAVSAMADAQIGNETAISQRLFANKPNMNYTDAIGYYLDLFAGHVTEGEFRANGSSGGFASWILAELLKTGDVDYVVHVESTCNPGGPLFQYTVSDSQMETCAGAGSRYYPVELSSVLKTIKSKPGRYVVVGIPSILMELRLLAEASPVIRERICYTVGLICGHQKSTKYVESLAWQCGIKPGDLTYFNFRKKIGGMPASTYHMEMVGDIDGEQVTINKSEFQLFGSNWGHGFFKAKFSDFTDDALNETADVSVGDAWLPEYVNDSDGNNIVIVRNETILRLIRAAISEGRLKFDSVSTDAVLRSQSGLIHHTRDEIAYRLAKCDRRAQWRPHKRIEASFDLPFLRRAVQDTREQIAALSHVHYEEAVKRGDWSYFQTKMQPLVKRYERLYVLLAVRNNEVTMGRIANELARRSARRRGLRRRQKPSKDTA